MGEEEGEGDERKKREREARTDRRKERRGEGKVGWLGL